VLNICRWRCLISLDVPNYCVPCGSAARTIAELKELEGVEHMSSEMLDISRCPKLLCPMWISCKDDCSLHESKARRSSFQVWKHWCYELEELSSMEALVSLGGCVKLKSIRGFMVYGNIGIFGGLVKMKSIWVRGMC